MFHFLQSLHSHFCFLFGMTSLLSGWRVYCHSHSTATVLAQKLLSLSNIADIFSPAHPPRPASAIWQECLGTFFILVASLFSLYGRLGLWFLIKVTVFLGFQLYIPYALLVGDCRTNWLVFVLKLSLSLNIRWAGMLCWKYFPGGITEILIFLIAVVLLLCVTCFHNLITAWCWIGKETEICESCNS